MGHPHFQPRKMFLYNAIVDCRKVKTKTVYFSKSLSTPTLLVHPSIHLLVGWLVTYCLDTTYGHCPCLSNSAKNKERVEALALANSQLSLTATLVTQWIVLHYLLDLHATLWVDGRTNTCWGTQTSPMKKTVLQQPVRCSSSKILQGCRVLLKQPNNCLPQQNKTLRDAANMSGESILIKQGGSP